MSETETKPPAEETLFANIRVRREGEAESARVRIEAESAIDLYALKLALERAGLRHHGVVRRGAGGSTISAVTLYGPRQTEEDNVLKVIGIVRQFARGFR